MLQHPEPSRRRCLGNSPNSIEECILDWGHTSGGSTLEKPSRGSTKVVGPNLGRTSHESPKMLKPDLSLSLTPLRRRTTTCATGTPSDGARPGRPPHLVTRFRRVNWRRWHRCSPTSELRVADSGHIWGDTHTHTNTPVATMASKRAADGGRPQRTWRLLSFAPHGWEQDEENSEPQRRRRGPSVMSLAHRPEAPRPPRLLRRARPSATPLASGGRAADFATAAAKAPMCGGAGVVAAAMAVASLAARGRTFYHMLHTHTHTH